MAEQKLEEVKEKLQCLICLDIFTDPKLLQCSHVYCQHCLKDLVTPRNQPAHSDITCPQCRHLTPIPDKGVSGLPEAFHLRALLDIFRIDECSPKAEDQAAPLEVAALTDAMPSKKVRYCFDHRLETKLYCETCKELICDQCALEDEHHSHIQLGLSEAFNKYKEEISSSLEPMKKQIAAIKEALAQLGVCCKEISDQQVAINNNIQVTFSQLQKVLDTRKTELVFQLDKITDIKLKSLASQKNQLEFNLTRLESCLLFMEGSLKSSDEDDELMMRANTLNQVDELRAPFQQDSLVPNVKADTIFSASADATAACQNYGQVCTCASGSADPTQCYATKIAEIGKMSTVLFQAINFVGKPCEDIKSLEAKLLSTLNHYEISCSIEERRKGQCEISYQPAMKGRHQLHIEVEGHHMQGSPFNILVKSPVEKLGAPILPGISELKKPRGVAVNQRGEVIVTEVDGYSILVFSPGGEKLLSFGALGSDQGQFSHLRGVAVDNEENILVVDSGNHRIQKFTAEGQFLAAVGNKGSGNLEFTFPTGIAVSNMVYVADWTNHIQILNSDLTFSSAFGGRGKGKGHFRRPWGIACDSTGKVYIADSNNHRIQVFTADGVFLTMFGSRGLGDGQLNNPVGIAIDSNDTVYVSEAYNHRISVFTADGRFLKSFGTMGKRPGEFQYPNGLAIDDSGVVYVCDSHNGRVQLF